MVLTGASTVNIVDEEAPDVALDDKSAISPHEELGAHTELLTFYRVTSPRKAVSRVAGSAAPGADLSSLDGGGNAKGKSKNSSDGSHFVKVDVDELGKVEDGWEVWLS